VGDDVAEVRAAIARSDRVVTITGAGISAESGIPTFRGVNGLWRAYRVEELASPEGFARDPGRVWEWYEERRGLVLAATPNPAHEALVELERRLGGGALIVTQNVDGLHRRAGARNVLELHGSLFVVRCSGCGLEREDAVHPLPARPPRCARCDALERPAVVWFGEQLPVESLDRAVSALREADVCLVVGTSGVVQPAASLFLVARSAGALTVEVNVERTDVSAQFDLALEGKAGEVLPRLLGTAA
jgi:NAD-dependent deacetylase